MGDVNQVQGKLPLLPLRGLAVFPNTTVCIDVGRDRSLAAMEAAMEGERHILLVAQRNVNCEQPERADLYTMGTVARVRHVMPASDDVMRLVCEGESRALLLDMTDENHHWMGSYVSVESDMAGDEDELIGYAERAKSLFTLLARTRGHVSGEMVQMVESETNPGTLADVIAANSLRKVQDKQEILECRNVLLRLQLLCRMLREEGELARIEHEIEEKTKANVDEHQREYYLREQLKIVQEELGDDETARIDEMRSRLEKSKMNDEAREKTRREIDRLAGMPTGTPEQAVCENYIDWMLDMPWGVETAGKIDVAKARKVLEADHYGLEKVKERILEYLAVCQVRGDMKSPILCLVGPPGVGKTSIAASIARALKRKYVRVALGGLHDEAEIRGHRRTYIGSQPGRIMSGLRQCGTADPVFLFDEIDKMASDFRGDPASAMLEALDPAQNNTFTDHYLDAPFDLSKVLFITTANSAEDIPEALLDRMELIEVPGYTLEEKVQIAKKHLLPRQLREHGLRRGALKLSDKTISAVIDGYTREAGVRTLEREIGRLCRKTVMKMLEAEDGEKFTLTIKPNELGAYLGVCKFLPDDVDCKPEIGVVNGLAWTQAGGTTMPIEAVVMPGQGSIEMTGRLGDVMKESARAALSFIRAHSAQYGLEEDFYKKYDIHIHVPEGAVPKDGPSAGVALACAVLSALTGRAARQDVAMTGEITLRGRVLPIGGVKEKLLAAYRLGIVTLLLPRANEKDLEELPADIRAKLDIHLMAHAEEAIELTLLSKE